MSKETEKFQVFLRQKRLNSSWKRDCIVRAFFTTNEHVSAQDLTDLVKQRHPQIGYTTVYRTLKLIAESGLAEVVDFDDGVKRYERKDGREYHAHFICAHCGQSVEVFQKGIKTLVTALARQHRFIPQKHRFEIFGACRKCQAGQKPDRKPQKNDAP